MIMTKLSESVAKKVVHRATKKSIKRTTPTSRHFQTNSGEEDIIENSNKSSSDIEENPWYNRFTKDDALYNTYMANEWSFEVRKDDRKLFEKLCLEGAQSGLSWKTILYKREAYREIFHGFDVIRVSQMTSSDIDEIMQMDGGGDKTKTVVKHRGKLESVVHNAKQLLTIAERDETFTTFSDYLWSFVDDKPILNHWKKFEDMPSKTDESEKMSKGLKSHGFKFVGPTTCYSLMQSCGLVIDHPLDSSEWKAALKRLKDRDGGYQARE